MRTSSNPVFSSLSSDSAKGATALGGASRAAFHQGQYGQQGFGAQPGYATQQPQFASDDRPMTIDDVAKVLARETTLEHRLNVGFTGVLLATVIGLWIYFR